jgi:prepilin-type N-terminal cleavage/methylation domain-containing protein/prepilin-type processing-associated H-X9-DG protein
MHSRLRKGFTLIELLVVIAIIAILIGLLLPAVQKVREAANRMKCSNNLKQIALGNMNYESTYSKFLPGVSRTGCCWGTWMIAIMPFMEQDNLYKGYVNFGGNDTTGPRYAGGVNAPIARTRLTTLLCPSDMVKNWNNGSFTMHNYVLNAGNSNFYQVNTPVGCTNGSTTGANGCVVYGGAPFGWYEDPDTLAAGGDASPPAYSTTSPELARGRARPMAEITDGTSNTLCVSEVIKGPRGGDDIRGFTWWGGGAGFVTFQTPNNPTATDVMTGGGCGPNSFQPALYPCTTNSTATLPRMQLARSRHTQGVNAALCDGSVRFVRNSVSLVTWRAAGSAQGGEVFANDW